MAADVATPEDLPASSFSSLLASAECSDAARGLLLAADHVAAGPPGARHVAHAVFCQQPVGPRIAWATCVTDVRALQRDVEHFVKWSAAEAHRRGLDDDAEAFVRAVQEHEEPGAAMSIGSVVVALFDEQFKLAPLFATSGLTLKDVRTQLPGALRAVSIYAAGHVSTHSSQSAPDASSAATRARISKALRTARGVQGAVRGDSGDADADGGSGGRGGATASVASPQAPSSPAPPRALPEDVPADTLKDMLELAPRAAKRATATATELAKYGVDLVEQAREGRLDPVIDRDAEISRVLQILARRTKNNVCLVGAPGVGKTAVAEAVAQRIADGNVPPQLEACESVWSLDMGALLAGTGLRGDFEERLRLVFAELKASRGRMILFIDELHLVLGAGRSENNNVDAANLMKPMLARGEIRCIGATTSGEYQRLILEKDAAFERRFQVVELVEPSPESAARMLENLAPLYAAHHGVGIDPEVVKAAVTLSHRRIHGRSLPDKAIDVLDEACCLATEERASEVTEAHVETVVARFGSAKKKKTFSWPWSRL